jgi:lipoyl-dependent peroxiredoxin
MAMAERTAEAVWQGNLFEGTGKFSMGSGAISEQQVTWRARTEEPGGKTSPEELIAAAQATCYAMALSNTLAQRGTAPERLDVTATCTLDRVNGSPKITHMLINVRGTVPGLDQAGFEQAARDAEQGCPVANALRNNVQINVQAQIAQ